VALKIRTILVIVTLSTSFACNALDNFSPTELTFKDGFGSRKGDRGIYVLTGCCWIRGIRSGDADQFATKWIGQHPHATVTRVSKMLLGAVELVFIWVKDEDMSLNVDFVRAGMFPSGAMADMVDNYNGLTELFKKPELAFAREQFEKGRAETPQEHPQRLISENEYQRFARRIGEAEIQARAEKLGIWSDAMKEERESVGYH
jgi:hypothetical protein